MTGSEPVLPTVIRYVTTALRATGLAGATCTLAMLSL